MKYPESVTAPNMQNRNVFQSSNMDKTVELKQVQCSVVTFARFCMSALFVSLSVNKLLLHFVCHEGGTEPLLKVNRISSVKGWQVYQFNQLYQLAAWAHEDLPLTLSVSSKLYCQLLLTPLTSQRLYSSRYVLEINLLNQTHIDAASRGPPNQHCLLNVKTTCQSFNPKWAALEAGLKLVYETDGRQRTV